MLLALVLLAIPDSTLAFFHMPLTLAAISSDSTLAPCVHLFSVLCHVPPLVMLATSPNRLAIRFRLGS
jgi:hypothetical protein